MTQFSSGAESPATAGDVGFLTSKKSFFLRRYTRLLPPSSNFLACFNGFLGGIARREASGSGQLGSESRANSDFRAIQRLLRCRRQVSFHCVLRVTYGCVGKRIDMNWRTAARAETFGSRPTAVASACPPATNWRAPTCAKHARRSRGFLPRVPRPILRVFSGGCAAKTGSAIPSLRVLPHE